METLYFSNFSLLRYIYICEIYYETARITAQCSQGKFSSVGTLANMAQIEAILCIFLSAHTKVLALAILSLFQCGFAVKFANVNVPLLFQKSRLCFFPFFGAKKDTLLLFSLLSFYVRIIMKHYVRHHILSYNYFFVVIYTLG